MALPSPFRGDYTTYELTLKYPADQAVIPKETTTMLFPSMDQLAGALRALSLVRGGYSYQIWSVNVRTRIRSGPLSRDEILAQVEAAYKEALSRG